MKTVFSSHNECAHIWASRTQYEGSASRVFFEGDIIYSYGRHFPVAKFGEDGITVFFTNRGYSSSTGKHKSLILSAIPCDYRVIYCDDPTRSIEHNLGIWQRRVERLRADFAARAHKMTRGNLAVQINLENSAAGNYCDAVKMPRPAWIELSADENAAREYVHAATVKRNATRAAKQLEHDKLAALESVERLALWQAGENVYAGGFQYHPTMLRIKGENIQTSRGANIPVADALKLWPLLERVKQSGKTLEAGLHNINLGAYRFNSFDGDTLIVGCHSIAWPEIEKMAIQLNLLQTQGA
jgi:hypothetical protein